jgi:hypothetical protein
VARHVRILETAGLIQRKKFGKTHVLRNKIKNTNNLFNALADTYEVNVPKGSSILEVLKKVGGVEVT